MDLGLNGKTAAVAAASSGLGRAAARSLAREGVRVAICGRRADRLADTAKEIGATPIVADVSTADGAAGFVERARAALGGVDILVTNCGGPPAGNFTSTSMEAYPAALNANLMSVVAMCYAAVPDMRRNGWGRIVAISSISVRQPIGNLILSNTARAGAAGFLKTLALELAPEGVTVNSVLPGHHDTDRIRQIHGDRVEALGRAVPVGRLGDAGDLGEVVAFLCSRPAGFITGTSLSVDGGAYAGLL